MNELNVVSRRILATLMAVALAACVAPSGEESTRGNESAITNGTPQNLGANSFVRLPTPGCTGTLLSNSWVLTANHCASNVGDPVYMDNQSSTVARIVPNPEVQYGVDIALLKLASPMYINGTNSGFRRGLRTTVAAPGTHVRCFGYGKTFNGTGIDTQLRLEEVGTAGGANDVYSILQNSLGQSATPGDAGGACLDDSGYAIVVMRSFTQAPTVTGETYAITSTHYASWANALVSSCASGSDCSTGICSAVTHTCVSSYCDDGVRDNGETGVDCGGSCGACFHCPLGMLNCGDGVCVKHGFSCP